MSQKFKSDIEVQAGLRDSSGALGASGQILSSTNGNVSWVTPTVNTVARDVQNEVKAGVAINKGQAVYVTGADGTNIIVGLASNTSEATSSKTLGLLNATVAINGKADVVQIGRLSGLNTIGAVVGDPVWLGTNGNLIYGLTNKPYAPAHLVFIGVVTRVNASNGEIFITVQNGFELNEIHDVDLKTTVPINGDILGYNGTLWVNKTIAGWLGYTPANASGTTNYVSKFTGSTTLGNSQIFDNGTNVGIGTASPTGQFEVFTNAYKRFLIDYPSIYKTSLNFGTAGTLSYDAGPATLSLFATDIYGSIALGAGGSERMRIIDSGNVGIGTSSPDYPLEIENTNQTSIVYQRTGVAAKKWGFISDNGATYWSNITDNILPLTLQNGGNVGIGTTSPTQELEVNGTILSTDGSFGTLALGAISTRIEGNAATREMKFYTFNSEKMIIDGLGNVGIGTSSPVNKLEVNGRTLVNELQYTKAINISSTNLNDYTFAGFYNGESMTNAPNSGWFWVTVERYSGDDGWAHQTATSFGAGNTANEVYTRTKTGGTWTNWKRLIDWTDINGTTNYVSKFTGNNSLGNSLLYDNGTNVGIGTTSPTEKLTIANGKLFLTEADPTIGGKIYGYNDTSTDLYGGGLKFQSRYYDGANYIYADRLTIKGNGNVGIGTTSPGFATAGRTVLTLNGPTSTLMEFQNGGVFKSYLYQDGNGFEIYDISSIKFSVNGGERARLDSSGRFGIATSTPQSPLSIGTNHGTLISIGQPIWSNTAVLKTDWDGTDYTQLLVASSTSNSAAITLRKSGNVGIENSSPSEKLVVGSLGGGVKRIYVPGTYNFDGSYLSNYDGNGGGKLELVAHTGVSNAASWRIANNNDTYGQSLTFSYAPNTTSYSGLSYSAPAMLIANTGNVGIGTTGPSAKLNVYGDLHLGAYSNLSSVSFENRTGKSLFSITTNGTTNAEGTTITYSWADGGHGPLKFNNASNEVMRLSPSGNLGIGTTAPIHPLSVVGRIGGNIFVDSHIEFLSNGNTSLNANNNVLIGYSQSTVVTQGGNVGINTTAPASSALLDLKSDTQGFLPPRMSTTSRDNISSPAIGLMIYNEDSETVDVYTATRGWRQLQFI
jgi:hypothetical protein